MSGAKFLTICQKGYLFLDLGLHPKILSKSDIKKSFEEIGEDLAKDCPKDTSKIWEHRLLKHNENELKRIRKAVKLFLFNDKL